MCVFAASTVAPGHTTRWAVSLSRELIVRSTKEKYVLILSDNVNCQNYEYYVVKSHTSNDLRPSHSLCTYYLTLRCHVVSSYICMYYTSHCEGVPQHGLLVARPSGHYSVEVLDG